MKKQLMILTLVLITALLAIMLVACTPEQEQAAVDAYGEGKAFYSYLAKDSNGACLPMNYYIDSSVTGEYRTVSEYAASKASSISSKVNVNITSEGNSTYKFSTKYHKEGAAGEFVPHRLDNKITGGEIIYYTKSMNSQSLNQKKHIAVHEMGHSLGLSHIDTSDMDGYSVMNGTGTAKSYKIIDFTKFDKYNIVWAYGA